MVRTHLSSDSISFTIIPTIRLSERAAFSHLTGSQLGTSLSPNNGGVAGLIDLIAGLPLPALV